MAVAQLYTAVSGDTITAARWNNEFGNIYNNGTSIAFPATANISLAGFTLTLDGAGVSTLTSTANSGLIVTPGAKSGSPVVSSGRSLDVLAFTHTDTATAASGTATQNAACTIQRPTFAATNTGVTLTDGAAFYIANSPANGTNCTITNPWAQWVDAGHVRFDGNLRMTAGYVDGGQANRELINVGLTATVAANALTVTLVGGDGAALSITNAATVPFRTSPVTTGTWTDRRVTAAISIVLSGGSTIGYTAASQSSRIYVVAMDNAGTVVLGLYNPLSGTGLTTAAFNLTGINESILYSSTAEGGLGAADTAQTIYTTAAQTTLPIRILGYIDIATGATNGNWTATPTVIQVMGPGIPRTGSVVQRAMSWSGSVATGTTAIPNDATTPQDNEGDQYLSQALTQQMISSLVHVYGSLTVNHSAVVPMTITVSNAPSGATDTDASFRVDQGQVATDPETGHFRFIYQPQSLAAQTYRIRAGASTGATTTVNGSAGAVLNNNCYSHVIVEEIAL